MKTFDRIFAFVAMGILAVLAQVQDGKPSVGPRSSIQIEMPQGDIEIAHVESDEGMVLIAKCKDVTVKSQRLYLSDGKHALMFEASTNGFFTPSGKVNSAAINLRQGDHLSFPESKSEKWGAKRGEIYLLIKGVSFVPEKK